MKILLTALALVMVGGCTKANTPAPIIAIVQAAQGAICPMAQAFADAEGSKLATATGATNPLACGAGLYQPLVNASICNQPIPASFAGHGWKVIGDIPASALKDHALAVHANGIISAVVCPLGIGVIMGVVSANIPSACQGPNSLSASAVDAQFVAVCQTLTAALP